MQKLQDPLPKVACIVPTYNGEKEIVKLLDSLEAQSLKADLIFVDSSSTDKTVEILNSRNVKTTVIPTHEFNHGGTRQLIANKNPEYEIFIFLTQDAYLENEYSIRNIISPFEDDSVGAVCGRQLPHFDATLLAQHARHFNYGKKSITKTQQDISKLGIKAAFISNSFSAYRRDALIQAGGFPSHVILSEDMYCAAKQILSDWKIVYQADALCRHSHNYTLLEEFRRYFDQGVFHSREKWIREKFGGAGSEGLRYVVSELKYLGLRNIYLWPSSLLRNFAKLLAYKIGQFEKFIPLKIKKSLSMHKRYWDSPYAEIKK